MSSRNIFEGLGKFDGKRHRPISPYAGSWADQEAKRPRVPPTPEQERQRRAGIVHPGHRKRRDFERLRAHRCAR